MKRHLHLIALGLFVLCLLYNVVVWGALPQLPEVGLAIVDSAHREAPLATAYIELGRGIDGAVAALQAFGERRLSAGLGDGFARIHDDPTVAMDLILNTTWNFQHRWIKTAYWGAPLLLLLTIVLWLRRPRQVRSFGR